MRDWIAASLQPLASSVTVEVPKSVLKQVGRLWRAACRRLSSSWY